MDEFAVGDTVQMTGDRMTGNVGTVVWLYEERQQYLVRVGGLAQDYFRADELQRFPPTE